MKNTLLILLFFLGTTANATSNRDFWNGFLEAAESGDFVLFGACRGRENIEPVQCSSSVMERATGGLISGVGFGFFQHAALVVSKTSNSITVLHARGSGFGVGLDTYTLSSLYRTGFDRIQLAKIPSVTKAEKEVLVSRAVNAWDDTFYDNLLLYNNGFLYCSELVWYVYQNYADVNLADGTSSNYGNLLFPLARIFPDQLFLSPNVEPDFAFLFDFSEPAPAIASLPPIFSLLLDDNSEIEEPDITEGLIAHYEFENNANDSSGNNNNGTDSGGINYSAGVIGQAASFDGLDDAVQVPMDGIDNEVTISTWVKTDSPSQCGDGGGFGSSIIANSPSSGFGYNHALFLCNGYIKPEGFLEDGLERNFVTLAEVDSGQWHLISYTARKNGAINLYVDGGLVQSLSAGDFFNANTGSLTIGDLRPDRGFYYEGQLDDTRVYNRILSPVEIQQLYQLGSNSVINGLVAHYKFDGDVTDSSGNNHHGAASGNLGFTSGVDGQAANFDGIDDWIEINSLINDLTDKNSFSFAFDFSTTASRPEVFNNIIFSMHQNSTSSTDQNIFRVGTARSGGIFVSPNTNTHYVSGGRFNFGEFIRLVVVVDDGVIGIYADGEFIDSFDDNNFEISNAGVAQIGQDYDGTSPTDFFSGKLDNLKIYNRALTGSEVSALSN